MCREIGNYAGSDLQFIPVAKEEITPCAVKKIEADFFERGHAAEALSKEGRKVFNNC